MNVVMDGKGRFIEIQGTGEQTPFDRARLDAMLDLAAGGVDAAARLSRTASSRRTWMSTSPDAGPLVVVSSANHGKLAEIRSDARLPRLAVRARGRADAEWPSPEEDGDTFEANARIKASPHASGSASPRSPTTQGSRSMRSTASRESTARATPARAPTTPRTTAACCSRCRTCPRPSVPPVSAARSSSSPRTASRPSPRARARAASASSRAASTASATTRCSSPTRPRTDHGRTRPCREERDQPPRRRTARPAHSASGGVGGWRRASSLGAPGPQ